MSSAAQSLAGPATVACGRGGALPGATRAGRPCGSPPLLQRRQLLWAAGLSRGQPRSWRGRLLLHCSAQDQPGGNSSAQALDDDERRARLKTELIRATAPTKRGKAAQPAAVLTAVAALERLNPNPAPAASPLLNGSWSLLYQGPEVEQKKGRGEALEGPLLAFFGVFLGWAFRTLGITQIIDTRGGGIQNLAEFRFLALLPGSLNIIGTVAPAPTAQGRQQTRVDVAFTRFRLQLGWLAFTVPLGWANPTGWVETTYVDETFRIGHGDKGSVFITARKKD